MDARRSPFAHTSTWSFSLLPIVTAVGLLGIALLGLLARPLVAGSTSGAFVAAFPVASESAAAIPLVAAPAVEVAGSLVAVQDGLLGVQELGTEAPVGFPLDQRLQVVRDGRLAAPTDLQPGDRVRLTVNSANGRVLAIAAEPSAAAANAAAPRRLPAPSGAVAALAAVGLVAAGLLLAARLRLARLARPTAQRPALARPSALPDARRIVPADRGDLAAPEPRQRRAA